MMNNVIQVKLKEALEKRRKSLRSVHLDTKISYNTLINIKKGEVKSMSFEVLDKLCDSLGCEISEILVRVK